MTWEFHRFSLIFLLLRLCLVTGTLDFFELNNAQYDFNIDIKPLVFDQIPDDNDTFITVANKKGQQFVCTLPERPVPKEKDLLEGSSVNPKIAAEFITKNLLKCIRLKSGWWVYTLCPRKNIVQSHGKEGDADYVSNSLGIFSGKYAMPQEITSSEKEKMLYLEERYEMGAVCDITGTPRTAVVHYTCEPRYTAKDAAIYSVDEEASCEYRVEVRTGALCSIAQFQPPKPAQTQPIQCSPVISRELSEKLKTGEEIRKKNKEKARRELEAIREEYEEVKIRRWSLERRRQEVHDEEFQLKMRDLDEYYIDLTRDQLEWNIIAKTGEEPPKSTKETIYDLLDGMEAIETAQVFYDSVADEDRANLWFYFHNKKWREDGFPLLLNEVDVRNGFSSYVQNLLETRRLTVKQRERLARLLKHSHPSRMDAVIAYSGTSVIQFSLAANLLSHLAMSNRDSSAPLPAHDAIYRMTVEELEKYLRETHRHSKVRPTKEQLLDIFAQKWAMEKVHEIDPLRDDALWPKGRAGLETASVAEAIDRLLAAWKFYDIMEMVLVADDEIKNGMGQEEYTRKYGPRMEEIRRVNRAGAEFARYYELLERDRDSAERKQSIEWLAVRLELAGTAAIDIACRIRYETMRGEMIKSARAKLPNPLVAQLANKLGGMGSGETAVAVFRDSIDARAIMDQLEQAGLGGDAVKLQVHLKDGQVLTAEDDKMIQELIAHELQEARLREKTKQRSRAYEYEVNDAELQLL